MIVSAPSTICRPSVSYPSNVVLALDEVRRHRNVDIVFAGKLFQFWTDGTKKRLITFEHDGAGNLPKQPGHGQVEDPSYAKERWNPFFGLAIIKPELKHTLPAIETNNLATLLAFVREHHLSVYIDHTIVVEEKLQIRWRNFSIRELLNKHRRFRIAAIFTYVLLQNFWHLCTEGSRWRRYQNAIATVIRNKEIIIDLRYGGIGDCLCFSTLPRKLFEKYGMSFYLTERSRSVVRSPDFLSLCFEQNPYFKGFKDAPGFDYQIFVRERTWREFLFDRSQHNAIAKIEAQFGLEVEGVPELFYKPKTIPGYSKVILCDKNWFSGEKFGLYFNEAYMTKEVAAWLAADPEHTVEYVTPHGQDIFSYLDKIHSCGKFVCTFSGGNALAAALKKENAIIIVPENLDGTALSNFFFLRTPLKYLRQKSMVTYGVK